MLELSAMVARLREEEEQAVSKDREGEAGRAVLINQLQSRLSTQAESLEVSDI